MFFAIFIDVSVYLDKRKYADDFLQLTSKAMYVLVLVCPRVQPCETPDKLMKFSENQKNNWM